MSGVTLTKTNLTAGVWQGVLTGHSDQAPTLRVTHQMVDLSGVEVFQNAQGWQVRVPIPASLISDGVQSFVITDDTTGAKLNSFAIIAGEAVADDIRAEIDLLRAELDMLKRAFRRHCVETS